MGEIIETTKYEAVLLQIARDLATEIQTKGMERAVSAMGLDAPDYVDELLSWADDHLEDGEALEDDAVIVLRENRHELLAAAYALLVA